MRHIWSVLCSRAIIDSKSNNISLIEAIEELKFVIETKGIGGETVNIMGQMPADWVTLWVRSDAKEPEKGFVKDTIIAPSGKVTLEKEYEVDLQDHKRNRVTRRIMLPPGSESGIYWLHTQLRSKEKDIWKTVGEIPLDVTIERVERKER